MSTAAATEAPEVAPTPRPASRLYDIARDLAEALDRIEEAGGELSPEAEAILDGLAGDWESKVDRTLAARSELMAARDAAAAEAERLARLAELRDRSRRALEEYLLRAMEAAGQRSVETPRYRAHVQPTRSTAVAWTKDVELCPPEFLRFPEPEVDKKAALAAHKRGEALPEGFAVEERASRHLRVR